MINQQEKKITEIEKLQIELLFRKKGINLVGPYPIQIDDNSYHYLYKSEKGNFSFTKEYIDYNFLYLVHEYPGIKNEQLPNKLKLEDFQNWIYSPEVRE